MVRIPRSVLYGLLLLLVSTQTGCAALLGLRMSAGYTGSTASFDGDTFGDEIRSRPGFNLGVGSEMPLGQGALTFLPELQFSQEGAKFVSDLGGGMTYESTTKTNYLRVPALLGVRLGNGEGVRPMLFAGPNFGYLLGCKDEFDSESYDCSDDKNSFDFQGTLGGGLEFPLGDVIRAGIEGRYNLGFTNILSDDTFGTEKNRNWQARAIVTVPLGSR